MDLIFKKFYSQKHQAKQRGIEWELPYWEWLQIWEDSGHLEERGRKKGNFVMARYGDIGPYSAKNVKIIRCEINNSDAQKIKHAKHPDKVARNAY